jgi:hypothetical protein
MHCRKLGATKGERPHFIIQVSSQNTKVENHKEQGEKKNLHFALNLCLKMLNPKAESCKEQVAKESSYTLRILHSKLHHKLLNSMSSFSISNLIIQP